MFTTKHMAMMRNFEVISGNFNVLRINIIG